MTGIEAAQKVIELAKQEEYLAAELVARALGVGSQKVIRDWRRRRLPSQRVGRTILLPAHLALTTYFSAISPATDATSGT